MGALRAMKRQQKGKLAKRVKTAVEAYKEGLDEGLREGYYKGLDAAMNLFCDAMETLDQVKDIGPKRYQAILKHFGYKDKSELAKEHR